MSWNPISQGPGAAAVQSRNEIPFPFLEKLDSQTSIHDLAVHWWGQYQSVNSVPFESDFLKGAALPSDLNSMFTWVNVQDENPLNFSIENHPQLSNFSTYAGGPIRNHPHLLNVSSIVGEYLFCKNTGKPSYLEIEQKIGDRHRKYRRLLVPVKNSQGVVNKLIYAVRLLSEPLDASSN